MAYHYEYLNLSDFREPINLIKEEFWSTLKHSYPSDEEINRTKGNLKTYDIKNGQHLTMFYLQMDVLQLAGVFENFVESSTREYNINPFIVTLYLDLVIHGKLDSS